MSVKREIWDFRADFKCIGIQRGTFDRDLKIAVVASRFWKTTGTGQHAN
jgi:hypothetical protein